MKPRFRTLQDWRNWHFKRGNIEMIQLRSKSPYRSRILQAARKHGWDYPFHLAVGHRLREEQAPKTAKADQNINLEAEKVLLSLLFGSDQYLKGGKKK